jgi:hypothetical protein
MRISLKGGLKTPTEQALDRYVIPSSQKGCWWSDQPSDAPSKIKRNIQLVENSAKLEKKTV